MIHVSNPGPVDRLTAFGATPGATLVLTSDGTDSTLTGDTGDLTVVPAEGLVLHSARAASAELQYAFEFVDTIDRTATASGPLSDALMHIRNSADGHSFLSLSSRGEYAFGRVNGTITPQAHHILSFLQNTVFEVNNESLFTGILGYIIHGSTNASLAPLYWVGIAGSFNFGTNTTAALPTVSEIIAGIKGHCSHSLSQDLSGFSSYVLCGVAGYVNHSPSENFAQGNSIEPGDPGRDSPPGDYYMQCGGYFSATKHFVARMTPYPTNPSARYACIRVVVPQMGNTTDGDSFAVYGDKYQTGEEGAGFTADRGGFMRAVYPVPDIFTNSCHILFLDKDEAGGYGADAGGPGFDELGGFYFDNGTNNFPGSYEYSDGKFDSTLEWKKLMTYDHIEMNLIAMS